MLLCDAESTKVQPLIVNFLLEPSAMLGAFWQQTGFADMTLKSLLKT